MKAIVRNLLETLPETRLDQVREVLAKKFSS
jgi:hypothetical protein